MANWLSIQAAAEKYGVTEELIRVSRYLVGISV